MPLSAAAATFAAIRCTTVVLLLLTGLTQLQHVVHAEIFLYGDDPRHAAPQWDYHSLGQDWNGTDQAGQPWSCLIDRRQSPIHLQPAAAAQLSEAVQWSGFKPAPSNGSNVRFTNNGHTVMLTVGSAGSVPSIQLPVPVGAGTPVDALRGKPSTVSVPARLQQLHFHTASEHAVAGRFYPMEMHMVFSVPRNPDSTACPDSGCTVVVGVLWELAAEGQSENQQLQRLWQVLPLQEQGVGYLPAGSDLDVKLLLPANKSYVAYEGSLTTPPCTEGVLWVVLLQAMPLSIQQWSQLLAAVSGVNCTTSPPNAGSSQTRQWSCAKLNGGANNRVPQPLNGRTLFVWPDSADGHHSTGTGSCDGSMAGMYFAGVGTAVAGGCIYAAWRRHRQGAIKRGVAGFPDAQSEIEGAWLRSRGSAPV